ncbi:MAG: hypothetical protein COS88_02050 [Chloroflexi bacterium CG07_land_8_20_14_0_80_51_10]|nr:MAG: hypothetical protein COS88_02050 [Chloroflexi bacterium CG07_land_8_20_14_0_80_51_10]
MRILKVIGYVISGTLILLLLMMVVGLGAAWGVQHYLNSHQELKGTFEIPLEGQEKPITVNLYNQAGQTKEDIQQSLDESTLQGQMQLFVGPLNLKMVGLRIGVEIPIAELVDEISDQLTIKIGSEEK